MRAMVIGDAWCILLIVLNIMHKTKCWCADIADRDIKAYVSGGKQTSTNFFIPISKLMA